MKEKIKKIIKNKHYLKGLFFSICFAFSINIPIQYFIQVDYIKEKINGDINEYKAVLTLLIIFVLISFCCMNKSIYELKEGIIEIKNESNNNINSSGNNNNDTTKENK